MFGVALTYTADQSLQGDWAASQVVSAKNTRLFSLLVVNKGADAWLEIYDHASAATGTPIELPILQNSFMSLAYPNGKQFGNGVFVRLVSSQGGSIIGSTDMKVTAEFMHGPLS